MVIGVCMAVNIYGPAQGWVHSDTPPFTWLQGLISSNALLLTIVDQLYRQLPNARSVPANDVSAMTPPSHAHALLYAIKASHKVSYLLACGPTRARRAV